jgi:AhpD family alkylhydroperoxidase
MLNKFAHTLIDSAEKQLGTPIDEMRYLADHSLPAFRRWSSTREIANYHHVLPPEVYYVAKIAVYRLEDCGSCLQIVTHMALKSGVSREIVRAALDGKAEMLSGELQAVYGFAHSQAIGEEDPGMRESIKQKYGDKGLIELAIGIASARTFPAFKRALGFAKRAAEVPVDV